MTTFSKRDSIDSQPTAIYSRVARSPEASTHEPIQCTHDVNYASFEIVQFNHLTGELRHT